MGRVGNDGEVHVGWTGSERPWGGGGGWGGTLLEGAKLTILGNISINLQ